MKGDGGHEKVVPLPAGFLLLAQADAIVAKRPLPEAALSLGQTEAGAGACANLGEVQGRIDVATGAVSKVRIGDEVLNWAITQDIAWATSSGGTERAKTVRSLRHA